VSGPGDRITASEATAKAISSGVSGKIMMQGPRSD
jgi:hypothetical protein